MKICVCQQDTVWENTAENMLRCRQAVKDAARQGAELVVFPEMTLTGFSFSKTLADNDDYTIRFFSECSKECSVSCAFGYPVSEQGKLCNRLTVTDKFGDVVCSYDKIHPFSYSGEDRIFSAGNKAVTAKIGDITLGFAICYDLRFPELFEQLAKTADCIIVIANWPESRREHWQTLLKARAIENQCYIAGCNRCGNGNGLYYSGDSAVYAPDGALISLAESGREQLIFADILHEYVSTTRSGFPVRNDRRIDLYRNFYE
ncbi:MAG: carbon-nitrogen family hydrolase [Oscillospiraceae bacterium]